MLKRCESLDQLFLVRSGRYFGTERKGGSLATDRPVSTDGHQRFADLTLCTAIDSNFGRDEPTHVVGLFRGNR